MIFLLKYIIQSGESLKHKSRTERNFFRYGALFLVMLLGVIGLSYGQLIQGPDNVCIGDSGVVFHTTNPGPGYSWTVVGGDLTTGQGTDSIFVNWDSVGIHRIYLTTAGTVADTDTTVVIVRALPRPTIQGSNPTCEFLGGQVYATPNFPGQSWQWFVNGGTFASPSNANAVSINWGVSDTVDLIVAETNNLYGCVGYDTLVVEILPPPLVELGVDTTICSEDQLILDAGPYSSVLWSNGSTNATLGVRDSGQYYVDVFDNIGCSSSDTINIELYGSIDSFIVDQSPHPLCLQDTVFLSVPDTFQSYSWGQGQTANEIIVLVAGTYTVEVEDNRGCTNTDTFEVVYEQFNNPNPLISPFGQVTLCGNDSLVLDPGPGYAQYLWTTGDSSQSITVSSTGDYQVRVWNGFGCLGWSEVLELSVFPQPPIPAIIRTGDSLRVGTWFSYQWFFDGFPIPNATSPAILPPYEGLYSVVLTDSNGCTITSDTFQYFFVGRQEDLMGNEWVKIYPNPAISSLFVEWEARLDEQVLIELLDPVGRTVLYRPAVMGTGRVELPLGQVRKGLYVLRLRSESKNLLRKIIVE